MTGRVEGLVAIVTGGASGIGEATVRRLAAEGASVVAVTTAVDGFGRLDCMFNNAGFVGAVGPIDEITGEEFDATMAVLLKGVFHGMKHAARVMKKQRSGVILSTSSIGGLRGGLGPQI